MTRAHTFGVAAATCVFAVGLNVVIAAGDAVARHWSAAGVQSLAGVVSGIALWLIYAADEYRAALLASVEVDQQIRRKVLDKINSGEAALDALVDEVRH